MKETLHKCLQTATLKGNALPGRNSSARAYTKMGKLGNYLNKSDMGRRVTTIHTMKFSLF